MAKLSTTPLVVRADLWLESMLEQDMQQYLSNFLLYETCYVTLNANVTLRKTSHHALKVKGKELLHGAVTSRIIDGRAREHHNADFSSKTHNKHRRQEGRFFINLRS
jgi:hypothetical protein